MKKHNFSKNILSSLITLGTIISFGYIAPSAEASSFWRDGSKTVTIDPGETFEHHKVDFGVGDNISFNHIHFWKTINWLTAGQITIDQSIMGQIHLNPGGNFSMHGYSNAPFVDQEWFTNIGPNPQTLVGDITIDSLAPTPIGPTVVAPGDSEHLEDIVNVPDPITGDYVFWKNITNVDPFPNWWSYQVDNTWELDFIAGGTWSDHHSFWLTNAFLEFTPLDGEWLRFTNTGTESITFELAYEIHSVPEPTSILSLLVLGSLGAGSTLKRKLKPSNSTKKEATKVG